MGKTEEEILLEFWDGNHIRAIDSESAAFIDELIADNFSLVRDLLKRSVPKPNHGGTDKGNAHGIRWEQQLRNVSDLLEGIKCPPPGLVLEGLHLDRISHAVLRRKIDGDELKTKLNDICESISYDLSKTLSKRDNRKDDSNESDETSTKIELFSCMDHDFVVNLLLDNWDSIARYLSNRTIQQDVISYTDAVRKAGGNCSSLLDLLEKSCSSSKQKKNLGAHDSPDNGVIKRARLYSALWEEEDYLDQYDHDGVFARVSDWSSLIDSYSDDFDGYYEAWFMETMKNRHAHEIESTQKLQSKRKKVCVDPIFRDLVVKPILSDERRVDLSKIIPPPVPVSMQHPASWNINDSKKYECPVRLPQEIIHPAFFRKSSCSSTSPSAIAVDELDFCYDLLNREAAAVAAVNATKLLRLRENTRAAASIDELRVRRKKYEDVLTTCATRNEPRFSHRVTYCRQNLYIAEHKNGSYLNSESSTSIPENFQDESRTDSSSRYKTRCSTGALKPNHSSASTVGGLSSNAIPYGSFLAAAKPGDHVRLVDRNATGIIIAVRKDGNIVRHVKFLPSSGIPSKAVWIAVEDGLISPVAPPVGAHDFAAIFSSRQSTKATVHLMKTSNDNVKQFSKQDVLNDLAVIGKDGTATFSTTIEQNICSNSCSKLESNAQQIEVPDVQANSLDTNKDCNHQPKNNLDLLAMCIENGMVEYGSRTSLLSERYANGDVNSKSSIYNSYINDNGNSVYSNGSTVGSSVKKKIDWMKRINYRNNGTNVSTEDVDGMSSATDGKLSVINNLRNVEIPGNSGAYFPQHESKSLKECDGLINTAEEEDSSMFKHKHYPQIVGIPKFDGTFGNFDFNGDDLSLKDSNVERLHTLSSIVQENGTNAGIGDLAPPNSSYRIGPGGTLLCVSFNSTK